jgi:hypothetical protein
VKPYYRRCLMVLCALPLFGTAFARTSQAPNSDAGRPGNQQPSAANSRTITVSDLSFLSGRWEGQVDNNRIEQTCSRGDPDFMMCMFRMMDASGTRMVEFYTLRNTADGLEERIRFFSPDLKEQAGDSGVTMRLASFSPQEIVFENPNGSYPKRSTLTRNGNQEMTSRIELIDAQGKSSLIVAHWTRTE